MTRRYRHNRHNYRRDPYWTTARFDSECSCSKAIRKGDSILYFPPHRYGKGQAECETCGNRDWSLLQDEIANERLHIL